MLELTSPSPRRCDGVSRRSFLKIGTLGFTGLTLADALRVRASASAASPSVPDRSVILIWLDGGPPQHETYDPKPDAPAEFRGPLEGDLDGDTRRAGLGVAAEPRAAPRQDVDHPLAAPRQRRSFRRRALDVDGLSRVERDQHGADVSVGRLDHRPDPGAKKPGIPAYVGLPHTHSVGIAPGYHGSAYLGASYNPFNADGDPNYEGYRVPNLSLPAGVDCATDGRPTQPARAVRPRPAAVRRIPEHGRFRPLRAGGVLAGAGSGGARGRST